MNIKIKEELYKEQNGFCNICKEKKHISEMVITHITPISKGGNDDMSNLVLVCNDHNLMLRTDKNE